MVKYFHAAAAAAAKSLQSCPTLYDPIHGSPPGSPIPGTPQARTLEWVASSFSNAWKWKVKVNSLSWVWLFMTPWTAAYQAPPSMGFSRQEYWSGLLLPSPWGIQKSHELLKKNYFSWNRHWWSLSLTLPPLFYYKFINLINFIKFIKFIKFKLSIYFWLHRVLIAVCRLAPVAASGGYSPVVVVGLLTMVTPLVAEHML